MTGKTNPVRDIDLIIDMMVSARNLSQNLRDVALGALKEILVKSQIPANEAKAVPVKAAPVKDVTVKSVPAKTAPVKAVPVKAAPVKTAPVKTAPVKTAPVKAAPVKDVTVKSVPAKTAPAKTAPAKTAPAKTAPVKTAPAKTAPAKTAPVKAVPVKDVTVKAAPVKAAPAKAAPAKTAPAKTAPAKTAPAKTAPAKTAPVKAAPAKAVPVKAAPVKAAPVKAAPVKAAPVKAAPAKAAPVKAAPAKAVPVKAAPAKAVHVKAAPVKAVHVKAAPVKAVPVKAVPVKAVPVKAVPVKADPTELTSKDEFYVSKLADSLGITNQDTLTRLEKIWANGRIVSTRGIFSTVEPRTYQLQRTGGRNPILCGYSVDEKNILIHPPVALRVLPEDAARLALFIDFEQTLLSDQIEQANGTRRMAVAELNPADRDTLGIRGIQWTEGTLSSAMAARGIPTISAHVARALLTESKMFASKTISAAPMSLWTKDGTPSDDLRTMCRKITDDTERLAGRGVRLALARLCFVSLIRIERFIHDASAGIRALLASDDTSRPYYYNEKETTAVPGPSAAIKIVNRARH